MSLDPFTIHIGKFASILQDNIDTDQIIPSREMKSVSKLGLGEGLFAGRRYKTPGGRDENPDFALNQEQSITILLSGKNFGCGSSREHAVWALHEYGFRAVIAESFGEIFYNNCVKNGILPVQTTAEKIAALDACSGAMEIDLPNQTMKVGDVEISFDVPSGDKKMLVEGLDAIALTELNAAEIEVFYDRDKKERPWAY